MSKVRSKPLQGRIGEGLMKSRVNLVVFVPAVFLWAGSLPVACSKGYSG